MQGKRQADEERKELEEKSEIRRLHEEETRKESLLFYRELEESRSAYVVSSFEEENVRRSNIHGSQRREDEAASTESLSAPMHGKCVLGACDPDPVLERQPTESINTSSSSPRLSMHAASSSAPLSGRTAPATYTSLAAAASPSNEYGRYSTLSDSFFVCFFLLFYFPQTQ